MRKLLVMAVLFVLVLGISSGIQAQNKVFKIGIALPTTQELVWPLMAQNAKAAAAGNSQFNVLDAVSADNQLANQVSQVDNLLSQGVDAILIGFVNTDAAKGICDKVLAAKVVLIQMDRLGANCNGSAYVTADSGRVARNQMGLAIGALGAKGNIIIIGGATGNSVADEFQKGYAAVLGLKPEEIKAGAVSSTYPNVKIVAFQRTPNWAPSGALDFVQNALSANNNNVQAIVSMNDGMVLGSLQAVQNAKLNIPLFGSDAEPAAVIDVIDGVLFATVDKAPDEIGTGSFIAARDLLLKQAISNQNGTINDGGFNVPLVLTPIFVVTLGDLLATGGALPGGGNKNRTLNRLPDVCKARPAFLGCK